MPVIRIFYALVLTVSTLNGFSQNLEEYQRKIFSLDNINLPYRILLPNNFNEKKAYPLVIFLHGAYSKGTDNEAQLHIGARYFLRNRDSFPAIVIFPHCPGSDGWAFFDSKLDSATQQYKLIFPFKRQPTDISKALMGLVDSMVRQPFVNNKKVYIGGLSQGGMGVLDLIARYPDTFTAAFSICGAGNISITKKFEDKVALWLFHGSKDDVIPVIYSRDYYRRLKRADADVRYSEYENVLHDSWVKAFAEPDLLSWLFSKEKKSQPIK